MKPIIKDELIYFTFNQFEGLINSNLPCYLGEKQHTLTWQVLRNLEIQKDGSLGVRGGLTKVAHLKTAAGASFYGSRDGRVIPIIGGASIVEQIVVGGSDGKVYLVPFSAANEAVVQLAGELYCPYRLQFAELPLDASPGLYGVGGYTKSFRVVNGALSNVYASLGTRQWFERLSSCASGVIPNTVYQNRLYYDNSNFDNIGDYSAGYLVLMTPVRYSNEVLALTSDGKLIIFDGVYGDSHIRVEGENLGNPIPYSARYSPALKMVIFATTTGIYGWQNGLINLTPTYDANNKLFADLAAANIWTAGSGYDGNNNAYFITYQNSTTWRTFRLDLTTRKLTEFYNAKFEQGSFYTKAGDIYCSLKEHTTATVDYPPAIYLMNQSGIDLNGSIVCTAKTSKLVLPGSREWEWRIRKIYITGKGLSNLNVYPYYKDTACTTISKTPTTNNPVVGLEGDCYQEVELEFIGTAASAGAVKIKEITLGVEMVRKVIP